MLDDAEQFLSEVERLASAAIAGGGRILTLNDQAVAETLIRSYYRTLPLAGTRHIVDVGAAYGSVAELFLRDDWTADLFEPDPNCQRILQRLLAAHGPRVRLFPFAAAAKDCESVPFQQNSTPGLSGLSSSPFGVTMGAIPVRTVRLDRFLISQNVSRVDFLKIDGGFVKDMADDPIDRAMVEAINSVGHVMGKKTIAEFVDSDRVMIMLREMGVDFAQGFGVAKPRPFGPRLRVAAASA